MAPERIDCWIIQVRGTRIKWQLAYLQQHDECFLTAHTKLGALHRAAKLSTEALAIEFCKAVTKTMLKRHGGQVELVVEKSFLAKKEKFDDDLVRARIEEGNFAPNRTPLSAKIDPQRALAGGE
ncbi:hypothetical protein [Chitinimonas lacunae]|uniref:Uncharacterized protein n=1 Tax=Chitinimonas lacunae TaxID=1963018 RepID=A0ABV8MXV4_9NEIS